jgi:CubicO group peptidase (beta-lactamase class C family)
LNVKAWLVAILFPLSVAACGARAAPAEVYPKAAADIDATVTEWLAQTNVPSASIAIVLDGKIAYAQAYGAARLSPNMRATTETRYAIDSISKEFTAAAILILAQQNKLSLDDPAGKYLTNLGPAAGVTIRQLLTHTAGFLAAGFRPAGNDAADYDRGDYRRMGQAAARFPAGDRLAIFQYRFRRRGRHRRESRGSAARAVLAAEHLHAAGHGACHRG